MSNYLKNNVELIQFYENYYKNEFNIELIKNDLKEGKVDVNLNNLYKFRIFLDACIVLFNKEKFENDYFKNLFDPKNFILNIKNKYDCSIKYIERLFEKNKIKLKIEDTFYYEFNKKERTLEPKLLWESRKILRNAFAHMQYGCFEGPESDPVYFYRIFNEDNGEKKSEGIVIEFLCHILIEKLYLNQMTKSIAYKHTYFDKQSNKFIEIKYKGNQKYDSTTLHPMNNNVFSTGNEFELKNFLEANIDKFDIKSITVSDVKKYENTLCNYLGKKNSNYELGYFIKCIFDIETEFSNFMTHLIQLNDRLIDFIICKMSGQTENINEIFISIDELKEDLASWIEFKWFFKILYIINFSLRIEDGDLGPENYSCVCIDNFLYDQERMVEFINKKILDNKIQPNEECVGDKIYILTKIRNAIAHGRIKLEFPNEKIYLLFEDRYYKREEKIKIAIDDLDKFIDSINELID